MQYRTPLFTSLTLACPLLVARSPGFFRGGFHAAIDFRRLHIFARRPHGDPSKVFIDDKADVADLKRAIINELQLSVAPDRVQLLGKGLGGKTAVLKGRKKLYEEGVVEGSSVLVKVIALEVVPVASKRLTMKDDPGAFPHSDYKGKSSLFFVSKVQNPPREHHFV